MQTNKKQEGSKKSFTALFIYTVGTESIQTPLNFSLFVILQPFAKIIYVHFFSSLMHTQHPILTEKHRIVDIFADLLKKEKLKYHMVLSIQTLCSVFSRSTLLI